MANGQAEDVQDVTEPEDIEQEIERTRDDLAVTIDAIADRVSPKRVASRGVASAKDAARTAMATVQQRVARLRDGSGDADAGGTNSAPGAVATNFQVTRRPPSMPLVAGVVAAGGLLLGLVLRRRRRSGTSR